MGGECDVDADLLHEEGILAPYDAHDGLPRAEVLGEERHHHIQPFVLGETDDGVCFADALGGEEIHVCAVTGKD